MKMSFKDLFTRRQYCFGYPLLMVVMAIVLLLCEAVLSSWGDEPVTWLYQISWGMGVIGGLLIVACILWKARCEHSNSEWVEYERSALNLKVWTFDESDASISLPDK